MTIYLNMKTNQGIETVDEFTRTTESIREFRKYVNKMLTEYRVAGMAVYKSQRSTKDWKNNLTLNENKNTMKKQKFIEVHSDYQDPETGNIAIDAYLTTDDETPGRTVCWVSPDGKIIPGTNPECESDDLECSVVQEAIADARLSQEEDKQKLVDDVIDDLNI